MGVLNVTPDSFSDGGRFSAADAAKRRVDDMLAEGAEIVDVGAESTRPGAAPIAAREQIARLGPALRHAARAGAIVSVDTADPEVARFALGEGACIVNDTSCLADVALASACAEAGASLVLMHARGAMAAMPGFSMARDDAYADVVADVAREWAAARGRAIDAGLAREAIWLDPGLGFHKSAGHSIELVKRLGELRACGAPIVVGPSRKSFLAAMAPGGPGERLGSTIAACLACAERGADVLRVHDVAEVRRALAVHRELRGAA